MNLTVPPCIQLPRWDRHAWLCILIAAAVLIPRSWLISRQTNECFDSDYHLRHGLAVLLGTRDQFVMGSNDPPLGQMILALPMAMTGNIPSRPTPRQSQWRRVSSRSSLK